ncbi:hypothetical protein ABZ826_23930 [Streptomyces sp. NPDC047515]|uniref:hypothetical protein n=1 Tax=Streptomyces sp. NPDC047515 TaxID=3155380 RepID=UPI0033FF0BA0
MPTTQTLSLAPSAFTSPDIRPTGTDAAKTVEARIPDLDMEEIRDELFAALQSIEDLRHQHPYEASGYVGEPVYRPVTNGDGSGDANAKTNTNFGTHTPIQAPNPRKTAL